jgi:hypothetical protein
MAVKYFCDRCDREARDWDLKIVRVLAPPDLPLAIEACPDCAKEIRDFASTASRRQDARGEEPMPQERPRRARVPTPASMAMALPAARGLLYVAVAVLFFFLGSWFLPG